MVKTRRSLVANGSGSADDVQLQDLLNAKVLTFGIKLMVKDDESGEVLFAAVLTGDGWVEDTECEEKYPDISSWIHTLLQSHEPKKKIARKKLRALVRIAKETMGDEEEEDQCLWQCVQIEGGRTLADIRKSFLEHKKPVGECMTIDCEMTQATKDDAGAVTTTEEAFFSEKKPETTAGKKRKSSSCLDNEELNKKRRRKSADDIEPPDFNTAPIVKAFRRASSASDLFDCSSTHRSQSSTIPPFQPQPLLDNGMPSLENEDSQQTQPPLEGEEAGCCSGIVEGTQFDAKNSIPIITRIEHQNMAQGAPQLYGEPRDAESGVPSGMNKPLTQVKELSLLHESQEDVKPKPIESSTTQDLDKYDAPPATLLYAGAGAEDSIATIKEEIIEEERTDGPVIVGTSLKHELMVHLAMTVKKLGGRVSRVFDANIITHVVVSTDDFGIVNARTAKYEQGVVTGKWVVSFQWVLDSFAALKWLPEDKYVVRGDKYSADQESPVLKARRALQQGQKPLFHDVKFLISAATDKELGSTVTSIIIAGGGIVLDKAPPPPKRPEELLNDEDQTEGETSSSVRVLAPKDKTTVAEAQKLYIDTGRRPLSCEYVMDCVSSYRLLPTLPYELQLFEDGGSMNDMSNVEQSLMF